MQNHPQLLRRPLPPKLPKLPLPKKRVYAAKTGKAKPKRVTFTPEETTSTERKKTSFPDVSRDRSQTPISIQNLSLDHHVQERVMTISIPRKHFNRVYWHIPDTATGCIFFPSCHLASSRVFGKETSQTGTSRKSKREVSKRKNIYVDNMFKDILILSSEFSRPASAPSPVITPKPKEVLSEYPPLSKKKTFIFKQALIDLSETGPSPLPRSVPVKTERQWSERLKQNTAVVLTISNFPGPIALPTPILPRKPRRQSLLETQVTESDNVESTSRQSVSNLTEGIVNIKPIKREESHVIRGEGFKTINATRYETIIAMTNLAIINCQIHGRNALNLKFRQLGSPALRGQLTRFLVRGLLLTADFFLYPHMGFFIMTCPDLTPLASQLIYLNLSFNEISYFPTEIFCLKNLQLLFLRNNPIKEIPSEIQQLKFLRVFSIAFNLITTLPAGLFSLAHLEELDISYNSVASIPNKIQKLRLLENLNVNGTDLTAFPPAILKLNLKKLQFENTFTHPTFWKENSLNSPPCLTHLTSLFFLKSNLDKYYDEIPVEIQELLKCPSTCEWCHGPKFGEGFRVIRSCDIFGATQLPVLYHVCSSSCYRKVKESSFILKNDPSKRRALNSELISHTMI
ncbi:leucine-rich repeat-containing protein 63 isoform X1 [Acinonyx jubatus]|uniref:Leucine-rich repeat-containing protein 63 isoform X1 n=1 Tax=Acinonyx jubatus TaxID=32536 RepID=A0A6J1ZSX9_ACIJB|nr:leucine-rich repeat-containing protein 63 isoform X1 [Acinonyx jubatus]XP_053071617.1 leucine-rich repeat-containing protein 63 isoform X1 [Acinonyx jubatus]XP_053071628.1 leucine-rich repeat-containing protein 63 isoform X1 [Acinonyx jubatus]